jgi:hypothetical protein
MMHYLAPEFTQPGPFQPVNQTFEKPITQQPIAQPKNVPVKNPPPRPGSNIGFFPQKQNVHEEQKQTEVQRQIEEPQKQAKEIESPPKKIDYNNLSGNSQNMVDSLNKAKNVLGVVEVINIKNHENFNLMFLSPI